ncbi:MAG: 3'(2'),5'-bisphosphate nucleotidase CysQ [Gammaproteobacteria bacterium]|nr:3'(2'),5'-bisphosphate nucleotidase CysQ [Gammaproteobacteria bacterium]
MDNLSSLITPLLALCRDASAAICEHYDSSESGDFQAKGDDSPLTHADLDSDRILQQGLHRLTPMLPVLSEESSALDLEHRQEWLRYWLIDPLDGTREFLSRSGEFTINIALVDEHRPVLGLIHLPLTGQTYLGIPGQGAWLYGPGAKAQSSAVALATRRLVAGEPLLVLSSKRHRGASLQGCLDWLTAHWGPIERINSGSALKFCQMAMGQGDLYPRYARCCEWDTAAGQALVEAAGGAVLGTDGLPLRYNTRDSLYSPSFHAIADPANALWPRFMAAGEASGAFRK